MDFFVNYTNPSTDSELHVQQPSEEYGVADRSITCALCSYLHQVTFVEYHTSKYC